MAATAAVTLFALLVCLLFLSTSEGKILAAWDVSGADPTVADYVNASFMTEGLTAGPLRFGSGLTRSNSGWLFSEWPIDTTLGATKNFYWELTPSEGRRFRLGKITGTYSRDANGPQDWKMGVSSTTYVFSASTGIPAGQAFTTTGGLERSGARGSRIYTYIYQPTQFTLSGIKATTSAGVGGLASNNLTLNGEGLVLEGVNQFLTCSAYDTSCRSCGYYANSLDEGVCGRFFDPCAPSGLNDIYAIITRAASTGIWTVSRYSNANCTTMISTASSVCGDCKTPGTVMSCLDLCSLSSSSSASTLYEHSMLSLGGFVTRFLTWYF